MNLRHISVFNHEFDLVSEVKLLKITISFLVYVTGMMLIFFTKQGLLWKKP